MSYIIDYQVRREKDGKPVDKGKENLVDAIIYLGGKYVSNKLDEHSFDNYNQKLYSKDKAFR